jgi:hypothetical protein
MRRVAPNLRVTCPCCGDVLTVDATTGDVLAEQRPIPKSTKSFDEALGDVRGGEARRQDIFEKAFDRTRRLDDILDKKFEEARKKAAEDPNKKPTNPFDLE